MGRRELADFLRSRRERITPADAGLPTGRRRRTPGLRREEVAQLAFISTEYYTRLEQARGPHPSREVLAALARALRLTDAAAARYPGDPELTALIRELRAGSEEFARLWATHDVRTASMMVKAICHPLVGTVTVNCDVLDIADRDQRVVIYTAEPGSPAEQALQLLSVIGTQRMDVPG